MANITNAYRLIYDGNGTIYINRTETTPGSSSYNAGSARCFPAGPAASLYELTFSVVGGNTGLVSRNDFAGWTSANTAGELAFTHTLPDTTTKGVYSTSLTVTVTVRKKSNTVDAVAGNVVFTSNLTIYQPGDLPSNAYFHSAQYLGGDADSGDSEVYLTYTGNQLGVVARRRGPLTGGSWDITSTATYTWIGSLDSISNYAIQTAYHSGENFTTLNYTSLSSMVSGQNLIGRLEVLGGGSLEGTILVSIYRINVPGAVYEKYFRFRVQSFN